MVADLVARVRAEIEGRLAELRPAVNEYERLLGAVDALEASDDARVVDAAATRKPARGQDERIAPRKRPAKGRGSDARAAGGPAPNAPKAPKASPRTRKPRGSAGPVEQAIMAALEHGSHTLGELGVVTAMSAPALREGIRRLMAAGKIARTSREGRAAYALA
jgi:hypothetical protein